MTTYCYKCNTCDDKTTHHAQLADGNVCLMDSCGGVIIRDYKAESVNVDRTSCRG